MRTFTVSGQLMDEVFGEENFVSCIQFTEDRDGIESALYV